MVEKKVEVRLKSGLQARPAAAFVQEATQFSSDIFIEKDGKATPDQAAATSAAAPAATTAPAAAAPAATTSAPAATQGEDVITFSAQTE